jgi:hypothetical protein
MAWALLDDNFPNHPKVIQAGPAAAYLFVCGLCYCRKYHTDGFIPRKAIPMLGVIGNPRRLIDALVYAGLWDLTQDGFTIHGYSELYSDAVDKQNKESKRENGRKGGIESRRLNDFAPKPVGNGTGLGSSDLVLEEKKREADFANFWQAYPRKDAKQAALKAWQKIAPDDDAQRAMAADLERRKQSSQWLKDGGQFIPMPATYLNGRRWEDGFVERPRLAERTINVIKGFEDANEEIA